MCSSGSDPPGGMDAGAGPVDAGTPIAGCPLPLGHILVTLRYQFGADQPLLPNTEVELRGTSSGLQPTDAHGQTRFSDLPPGAGYDLVVDTRCTSRETASTSVTSAQTTEVTLVVQPRGTIRGRVTDAAHPGTGIGGATVSVTGPVNQTTTADAAGNYAIDLLTSGTYFVKATKPGFTTQTVNHVTAFRPCGSETVDLQIEQVVLEIVDHDTAAVISGIPQTRVVGQRISFDVRTRPAGLAMTSIQWTVPGNRIKSYTQAVGSATVGHLAAADLQAASAVFYWIEASAAGTVQVSARVQDAVLTANVRVDVLAPTGVSFSGEQCATTLGPHFLYPMGLNAYDAATGHFGVQWTATCTAPAGGAGEIGITQLITRNFSRSRGATVDHIISPAQVLDDGLGIQYSGSRPILASAAATLNGPSYTDSPGSQLIAGVTATQCNDQFTDFFMYKPATANAIWVTLARLTWTWNGSITAAVPPAVGWVLGAHAPVAVTNQVGAASAVLPEWTSNLAPVNHWA